MKNDSVHDSLIIAVEASGLSAPEILVPKGTGPFSVGRDPTCHVVLRSPDVSRCHLLIESVGRRFRVTDESANGTILANGQILHRASIDLDFGTRLVVGPYTLIVSATNAIGASAEVRGVESKVLKYRRSGTALASPVLRRRIHRQLLDYLDLAKMDRSKMAVEVMRPRVRDALARICKDSTLNIPGGTDIGNLIEELSDEVLGLGPLEALLADSLVTEIMVVDPAVIFVEKKGRIEPTDLAFTDNDAVHSTIERIITPLGRRIDELSPMVDARLPDGSRVNAIIPPLALRGPCITIRRFSKVPFTLEDLIQFGTLTDAMAAFLTRSVVVRKNIVVSGGTGSGKTTLLNVLAGAIPTHERIITIEDSAELRLPQPHVVSLEARPSNMEGRGQVSIRDLVKNALRMRPDRIVVGECRSGEALDMLQAMNTGHEGSMTTVHANSPIEAIGRIETLTLMAGLDLPAKAVREQVASSIDVVIQQARFSDGSRRITAISELAEISSEGQIELRDIFTFRRTGTDSSGRVEGEFSSSGYLPSYLEQFMTHGLVQKGGKYL